MERSNLKRSFEDDDMSGKPPPAKKVRYPKGKKVKAEDEQGRVVVGDAIAPTPLTDPSLAARERARERAREQEIERSERAELRSKEIVDLLKDVPDSAAEVKRSDYQNFVEDGVQFEMFNMEKDREEGYFDRDGNFVEYVDENREKDAWLDSLNSAVDSETTRKYAEKYGEGGGGGDEEAAGELSAEEIGKMKRRIADALEEGETVLKALRRLKGSKKEKMSAETKAVFDQLTEDAVMLMMRNGENNVYDEEKEVFEREAEGYESLARARLGGGILEEIESDGGTLNPVASIGAVGDSGGGSGGGGGGGDEAFDMFGDEDEPAVAADAATGLENNGGGLENDYVYDDASGYYYSHSSGYYYDPNTGLYCSAVSGLWYSYNEETGAYDEVAQQAPEAAAAAVN